MEINEWSTLMESLELRRSIILNATAKTTILGTTVTTVKQSRSKKRNSKLLKYDRTLIDGSERDGERKNLSL